MADPDGPVRLAAFAFLEEAVAVHGEVLPRGLLAAGFAYEGRRVPLVGPQGIFKPAVMRDMPLSITTAPHGPYDDSIGSDEHLIYRYRGDDPNHHENRGLRRAMETHTPLIYFYGLVPGQYFTAWPVYIVGDDPGSLSFKVALDDPHSLGVASAEPAEISGRRAYVTRLTRHRLHQASFRQRVIEAYRRMCSVCRLRHAELLDAAHILADARGGEPVISNGIALCKLHHAAFDQNIIGIRPDLVIEISRGVLEEIDGPMLRHGLQGFHGSALSIPRAREHRPDRELLEARYELFLAG
jgi:putative restriction endonuclease